ncbi:MAG: tRNA preQ1(34) S-adenosylmethionine ribosyltransferase-isomerase QueA [bacterium]|nr:tRNA preQ1(34) S-adenosylmethionine ribosyltransferase-isomerase QueA [bacterium]
MRLSDFDYTLPKKLIAQHPVKPRDHSRLMILDRVKKDFVHQKFFNCLDYFNPGDILVVNNSKVIPARLIGHKLTGGKIEIFLLQNIKDNLWECLVGGKKMKPTTIIEFDNDFKGKLIKKISDQTWEIEFNKPNITSIGDTPLPPYITESSSPEDYQTVYAKTDGSVAAPTAGLHFTPELMKKIKAKGIEIFDVTLHVGLGTFAPVKTEKISEHKIHKEYGELSRETAVAIKEAKAKNKRVIAVGTTSVRTLEAFAGKEKKDWIDLFITPGYKFQIVDAMLTNFHLPKSTLLMLVGAFAEKKYMEEAYQEAIKKEYRFYSFGDAMLIL